MTFDFGDTENDNMTAEGFPFAWEADIVNLPPPNWIVEDLIQEDSVFFCYGASQSLKSFFMLDLFSHMSKNKPWHGKEVIPGACAYIVAEGVGGVGNRVRAWNMYHHTKPSTATSNTPLVCITTAVNLMEEAQVDKLIKQLQGMEQEYGFRFQLVGIDTLAKCMIGGEENSARDMGMALSAADTIREGMKVSVGIVHHTGKDMSRGMRGSSASFGAVNTVLKVEREPKSPKMCVEVEKQKDAEEGTRFHFETVKVDLPQRPNVKKPESSLVLKMIQPPSQQFNPQPIDGKSLHPDDALRHEVAMHLTESPMTLSKLASLMGKSKGSFCEKVKQVFPKDTETQVEVAGRVKTVRSEMVGNAYCLTGRFVNGFKPTVVDGGLED